MSTIHEQRHHFAPLVIQPSLSQVVIAGDIQLFVTEMEATYGPIIGRYRIETPQMQEPFQVLWGSEGRDRWVVQEEWPCPMVYRWVND